MATNSRKKTPCSAGIFIWLFCQLPINLVAGDIHTGILNELERVAKNIRKSSEEVFIGIGRSPTPIIAVLQLDNRGSAYNVPLSNFRHLPLEQQANGGGKYPWQSPLTDSEREKLFAHFDTFIPSEKKLAGKKMVLLDHSESGYSIIASYFYLKEYLKSRGRNPEMRVVVMTIEKNYEAVRKRINQFETGAELYTLRGDHLPSGMANQEYDELAEYPQFKLLESESPKRKTSTKYAQLLRDIVSARKWRTVSERKAREFEIASRNMSIRPKPNPIVSFFSKLGCLSLFPKLKGNP